jgi:hypothetical protein
MLEIYSSRSVLQRISLQYWRSGIDFMLYSQLPASGSRLGESSSARDTVARGKELVPRACARSP